LKFLGHPIGFQIYRNSVWVSQLQSIIDALVGIDQEGSVSNVYRSAGRKLFA